MANHTLLITHLSILFFLLLSASNGDLNLNVADFGAVADGKTDASVPFLAAWASACASPLSSTIHVPRKTYRLGPVVFQGPCNSTGITFQLDGVLVAPEDYREMGTSGSWVRFHRVEGVSVSGGYLHGQGSRLWACKNNGGQCPTGAKSLHFLNSKNIMVNGLTSIDSKSYHITVDRSSNVTLAGLRIIAPGESPNTDGIHIQQSKDVRILNTSIKTGDDCISVGPGTNNLWVQRLACGPGHGVSIGSLGQSMEENGVQNVTVKNVVFNGTQNGFRIKTWARASNGFVKGVIFRSAVMVNVKNPIIIDQNYCNKNGDCPHDQKNSGIKISEVSYRNIKGTSATKIAVQFNCSSTNPCQGIALQDIKLSYLLSNQTAQSFCRNAQGASRGSVIPPTCL